MSKPSDPTIAKLGGGQGKEETINTQVQFDAASFEQSNVHSVYEAIANHFSDTRYKPWPLIPTFINSLPKGSVGADLGCGNGKYLHLRNVLTSSNDDKSMNDIMMIGMDRSSNLIDLARTNFGVHSYSNSEHQKHAQNEVAVGDAMHSNFRSHSFDFVISIATIHHFASFERRVNSIEEMIRIVKPLSKQQQSDPNPITVNEGPYAGLRSGSARFLIVVWALEQRGQSRRQFENVTPENVTEQEEDSKTGRDLLIPWILKSSKDKTTTADEDKQKSSDPQSSPEIYQRFYHVFQQGELEKTVEEAAKRFPQLDIQHELGGWEKGNWYGIWKCVER